MRILAMLLVLSIASVAIAGDREMEILLVNMTPDPVSAEGRTCAESVRRAIRADYTRMRPMGETALRQKVGRSDAFMSWTREDLEKLRPEGGETHFDAVALFDCRPEAQHLDALVLGPDGLASMRLRGTTLDAARARWLAAAILRQGWTGFHP